ncbi:MAG: DUF4428 domain-containing protein [Clostridia bacterium]|nr:DUF4428 domain-containing protein [Clostridia bacterium]
MGLFDKKFCDVCGEKIGLLGNRKLEDGNLCKDCAKKLSPFFDERRHSTVEQIKQQLSYREQNKQVLANFSPTMNFGDNEKVYIDVMKGSFVVSRRTPGNWSEENPDVIPLSSVMSCNLRIDEDRDEIYTQGKDGERVSYNPPRYKFYYNFIYEIKVNNPYFDEIEFRLNGSQVDGMGTLEYNRYQQMAMQITNNLTQSGGSGFNNNFNQPMNNGYNQPVNNGYAPSNGYSQPMNNGYAPSNGYSQPMNNGYAPANGYNQPMNNGYAPGNGYNQQMNNGYVPANNFNQQGDYVQPQAPVTQGWICPACNASNEGGKFCMSCGTPRG